MKTLNFLLLALLCCLGSVASAQCINNVQASMNKGITPNNIAVVSTTTNTDTATLYQWYLDGQSVTAATHAINYTYNNVSTGTHTICLYVYRGTPNFFCDSVCEAVFVPGVGNCGGAVAAIGSSIEGSTVTLSALGTYPNGTKFQWYMDDIGTAPTTGASTIVYSNLNLGSHPVSLFVYDANDGYCDSASRSVQVTANPNSCNGLQASFIKSLSANTIWVQSNSVNTNSNTMYQWYLDGLPYDAVGHYSTFTYSNIPVGMHNICLRLYAGSSNYPCDSICQNVFVPGTGPCSGAIADFNYNLTNTGVVLNAGANHYPTDTKFQWWLDGVATTPATGASIHEYTNLSPGAHQVCLYIYSAGNDLCDSACQIITIGSGGCNVNMNAIFTASSTSASTTFAANSNPSGTVYHWNFGDNTDANTTVPQTSHQYPIDTNTHIYTACLITRIPGTICADTFCTVVTVPGSVNNGNCQANFVYSFPQNTYTVSFLDSAQGTVISRFWDFGDGSTSTQAHPSHVFTTSGVYQVCLTIATSNGCTSTTCESITIVIEQPSNDTICGIVFSDANSNGVMDSSEAPLPGIIVMAGNYTAVSDSDGFYHIVYPGTFAVDVHVQGPQGCSPTLPLNSNGSNTNGGFYYVTPNSNVQGCGYNFGFNCNVVSICGVVYFDANNNGTQDNGENGLPNIHIELGSNGHTYHAYTNQYGSYCVTVPVGTYVIHAAGANYNTCALAPTQLSIAATTVGQSYVGNNFAIYCQPGSCNLEVTLTPHTTVTPGFQAWYDVTVRNVGATPATGTANLFYDAALSFISASPAASSHNASTQTLSFNLSNLMPGGSAYYYVKFNASQSLALNTPIFTLANVIASCNDVNLTNNVDTIHQAVTGSWDPNNKLAYVTNYETNPAYQYISSIDANQRIEYVINFQNEGNGPAVNVVVKDLITADLDINSFELLGTSHPCQVTVSGSDANFKFSNIMLPAKVTDEPNSHGFVKFAIDANSNLAQGHVIVDDAAIYFDYNQPVITNEAQVTLLGPNSIKDINAVAATIAPNPMQHYTTIKLSNTNTDGFKLRVVDITGRVVSEGITSSNTFIFERGSLSSGLYSYQVIQNNIAVANGKLVIQ